MLTVTHHLRESSMDEGEHFVRNHANFVDDDNLAVSQAMSQFAGLVCVHWHVLQHLIRCDVEQSMICLSIDVLRSKTYEVYGKL